MSSSLAQYYADLLRPLGEVHVGKMFSVFCIYINEKPVGFLCGEELLVKTNAQMREKWPEIPQQKLFDGAVNPMWLVEDPENQELLLTLFRRAYDNLPQPKPKKTRKKQKTNEEILSQSGLGSPLSDESVMGKDVLTSKVREKSFLAWLHLNKREIKQK